MRRNQYFVPALLGSMFCLLLSSCEILGENPSPFGFVSRNGTSGADTTDSKTSGGVTTVTDTWNNLQSVAKKATVLLSIDTSGSISPEIGFLADQGLSIIADKFGSEFETCFAVVGAYSNHADYTTDFGTFSNTVSLTNGTQMANPAGKLLPPNDLDAACLCVNDFNSTADVITALKANFNLKGSQQVGAGEAMVNSPHKLFTTPSLINPVISAGKCFQNDHSIVVISLSDETDYTLCPKDYSKTMNATDSNCNNDGGCWDAWRISDANIALNSPMPDLIDFNANDVNPECGNGGTLEYPGDTVGAMLHSTYNSVNDKREMHNTFDSIESDLRAFAGTLPFFWAAVGYDEASVPTVGQDGHKTPAYAEMAISKRFADDDAYHIPMQHAAVNTQNQAAFSAAFNGLADQLKVDASFLSIFDTQQRCPNTAVVKVDGQVLNMSKYTEVSLTRISITPPHNQGSSVNIEYKLDDGNC